MKTLIAAVLFVASVGCKGEPAEDNAADACERAATNVARLHAAERTLPNTSEPLTVDRCKSANLSRTETKCLAYASSWEEAHECSPTLLAPAARDQTASEP